MGYGRPVESTVNPFQPGINKGVYLTNIYVEQMNTPGYHVGPALFFDYTKEGFTITDKVPMATVENSKPREKKDGTMETQEEALGKHEDEITAKVKHIVTNYVSEEVWDSKIQEVDSFEKFCEMVLSLLPKDYSLQEGELICGINKSGYVEVPRAMYVTGYFFSVGGKKTLIVKTRNGSGVTKGYLNITPPVQAASEPEDAPTSETW